MEKSIFKLYSSGLLVYYSRPWQRRVSSGHGTCFCIEIKKTKYLVTNYHVIEGCNEFEVDGEKLELLFYDMYNDIALLSCPIKDAIPLQIGEIGIGDDINLWGFGMSMRGLLNTKGIISRLVKYKWGATKVLFFQSDVSCYPGNSGGPIINNSGEVIGILIGTHQYKGTDMITHIIPFFLLNFFIQSFENRKKDQMSVCYYYFEPSWQIIYPEMITLDTSYKDECGFTSKKLGYITHINNIKIGKEAQITFNDFLSELGYHTKIDGEITFTYLASMLPKFILTGYKTGEKKISDIEVKNPHFYKEISPHLCLIHNQYCFVPVVDGLVDELNVPMKRGLVYIAHARKNKKFIGKIIDIAWNDFIKIIKDNKRKELQFVGDDWIIVIEPEIEEETLKTRKFLDL